MSFEPLPSVPAADTRPRSSVKELEPLVRSAILLLVAFGVLNVIHDITYLIGSIQAYGAPQARDAPALIRSLAAAVIAGILAGGLYRRESWARWATVVGGFLYCLKLGSELGYLLKMRATGTDRADLQIVIVSCMTWGLVVAAILLLTPKASAAFAEHEAK